MTRCRRIPLAHSQNSPCGEVKTACTAQQSHSRSTQRRRRYLNRARQHRVRLPRSTATIYTHVRPLACHRTWFQCNRTLRTQHAIVLCTVHEGHDFTCWRQRAAPASHVHHGLTQTPWAMRRIEFSTPGRTRPREVRPCPASGFGQRHIARGLVCLIVTLVVTATTLLVLVERV
jgi:hypothetical protein